MKKIGWELRFGIFLVILSIILYLIHFVVFRNIDHILLWSMTSLAFLPVSVLFVTLLVNKILIRHGKKSRLEKLNMLIGTFFSEVGTNLIEFFSDWDSNLEKIKEGLIIEPDWTDDEFMKVNTYLKKHPYEIEFTKVDLLNLRNFLISLIYS